ncbi:MAG: YceD family protein [Caldimonas sp.]
MGQARSFDPRRFDVAAFAAAGAELSGHWPLSALSRLASAAVPGSPGTSVAWQVHGERAKLDGGGVQPALRLVIDADVALECQRCLQPMAVPLHVERRLFFVEGEDAAAALDAESEDDVLALAPALDLRPLIEDELLLALPIVPRHETCPEPLPRAPVEDALRVESEEHPFAALAALKRGAQPN